MTPTRKGLYSQCAGCLFKSSSDSKYPCILSHKDIRKHSGSTLERYFKSCGVNDEKEDIIEDEVESIFNSSQKSLF